MKVKIDRLQYFSLIPNLIYAKAIGVTAGILTRRVGADNWEAMTIGFIAGTMLLLVMIFIASRFPDKTIIQYSEDIVGKFPSKAIGIILALFFAGAFISSANVVNLHLKQYLLMETPFLVLSTAYIILCIFGVYLGIEVVIRFSFFAIIMALVLDVSVVLGTMPDFDIKNLLPLFDKGIMSNITASIYTFSDMAMAILAVGFIYPMIREKKKTISLSFWSMVFAALLVVPWPFTETGVLGADVMKQYAVVCMQQARSAQLSIYLPRYELIMVILFIWSAFVQSTVMFFCCFYSLKQTLGIRKDRFYFIALSILLITGTYYFGVDHNRFVEYLTSPWPEICGALSIGVPLILLPVALMRGKLKISPKS